MSGLDVELQFLSLLSLSKFLVLLSSCFLLFSQLISLNLFSLHFVNTFDQDSLVFILITFAGQVEMMVSKKC